MTTKTSDEEPRLPQAFGATTPYVLAVDPGLSNLGVAIFAHGRLVACDALYARDGGGGLYQIRAMAKAVAAWWREHKPRGATVAATTVVIERMVARPEEAAKLAVTNSLIDLAHVAGGVALEVEAARYIHLPPATWTGMRPKGVNHARMKKRLDADEQATVDSAHARADRAEHIDIDDAVCIGLFVNKRL